jgi:cytochrome c biogenesis protein CcmG/thiol:disulfide interchange protein DsbE
MRRILALSVFLVVLQVPAAAQSSQKAPDLSLKDIRGRRIRLANYRGKVVLLNFWATWCPPCRKEIPDLVKMQREYRNRGLQIIGVTYPPQTVAQVRRFARKFRVNYPVALGSKKTKALFDNQDILPVTVIIDREGNVRDLVEGIIFPEEFAQKIRPLLR